VARKLENAVVVITGASSGIGRAAALAFARRGSSVVVAARRGEALDSLVNECQTMGVPALAVPTDVTDHDALEHLAQQAEAQFGKIDVWINNAGVYLAGRFEDTPPDDFRRLMDVNFFGCVDGSRVALPRLRKQRGVLINTASVAGTAAYPYFTAYIASKWAVRGFTATLREENLDSGIDICAVLPACIDTPLFRHAGNYTGWEMKAQNPTYSPEMVADAMVQCAEHGTREIIVGGAGKLMAAQFFLTPRLAERMLSFQTNRDHFRKDRPAPRTPGSLYEPIAEGTDTSGGWGGSKAPDVMAGVGTAGLAVLVPAVAWLTSERFRRWISNSTGIRRKTPVQQATQRLGRLVQSLGGTR
jgi:short-subunit dehydrogenase